MTIKSKKIAQLLLVTQFIWTSVYSPISYAQVPPSGYQAGDWSVYQRSAGEGEKFVNLLLVLDTSDSMNQPESWRPYPGGYNSHIEYLWNEPNFINSIAVEEPIAPVGLSSATPSQLEQVRTGYWSFRLSDADENLLNASARQVNRTTLKNSATDDASENVSLSFDSSLTGANVVSVPKSIYRNYGGPVTESVNRRSASMWFNSSWIYWVKAGEVDSTNIYQSPFLYSTSFSRFMGANSALYGIRGTIPYNGDLNYQALNDLLASGTGSDHSDLEKLNLCSVSRYNPSVAKLSGLGTIAEGIKPSTTYAPGWSRQSIKDSTGLNTNKAVTPITLFNLGYTKNLHMVRFDPFYYATQTRNEWLEGYPGAGLVDNTSTVWPPVGNLNNSNYFIEADRFRFQPGYLDLRCWDGASLDVAKTLLSTSAKCVYSTINTPMRDNFSSNTGPSNDFMTNAYNNNQGFGQTGQPIRVLRQVFKNGVALNRDGTIAPGTVTSVPPMRRKFDIDYGGCGNMDSTNHSKNYSTETISVGSYTDYLCNTTDNNLRMGWTKLRSDQGGFVHARALYQLAKQISLPSSLANRESIIDNMLKLYSVDKFATASARWGKDNAGNSVTPSLSDQVLFSGWLGTRDCFELNLTTGHCATKPASVELATGTPAYFDHTRSTYHYWEKPDAGGTMLTNPTSTELSTCYKPDGTIVSCSKYIDSWGNEYTSPSWFNPIRDIGMDENECYDKATGDSPVTCTPSTLPAVKVQLAPNPYIRTGTYLLNDPNSAQVMENTSRGIGSNIISFDDSDTLGDVWPNNIDNISRGAREILSEVPKIRRRVACVADTDPIKYAATEAAQGSNNPNYIFTNYICKPATNYDPDKDCEVLDQTTNNWVGVGGRLSNGSRVNQQMCNNINIADPKCSQPASNGSSIRKYSSGACGFFSYRGNWEGVNNVISYGKSCSAIEGNIVYLIDWDNPTNSNTTALATQYSNWLATESSNIGSSVQLPNGVNASSIQFKNIQEVNRSEVNSNSCRDKWRAPALSDPTQLCRMTSGGNHNFGSIFGNLFSPTFYSASGSSYTFFNTGVNNTSSCQAVDPEVGLEGIACSTPSTTSPSHNNGYIKIGAPTEAAALAAAKNSASCSDGTSDGVGGIERSSLEYGGWRGELPFYVFEAYNVDKVGIWNSNNDGRNRGSLLNDPQNGRYMPALFHQCVEDDNLIGEGMSTSWNITGNAYPKREEFDNFYKFADQAQNYLRAGTAPSTNPRTPLSAAYTNSALSGGNSNVDLYSANYLNFVFGPKYQGAPIGRRTRIQVAQDVLAETIATNTRNIRIGLMAFNYLDANSRTSGGYVVQKMDKLEPVTCFEKTLTANLASNRRTLTLDSASHPSSWMEMVPQENGRVKMPADFIKSAIEYGGAVFTNPATGDNFPNIRISDIDADNGNITLATVAPVGGGTTVTFKLKNCGLPNYTALSATGQRQKLINGLFSLKAVSQTPLTETLYEAYLYYSGGTPKSGRVEIADNKAFVGNSITAGNYYSPIKSLVDDESNPDACMSNYILVITDGYPFDDAKSNSAIAGLSSRPYIGSGTVATNLANDTTGYATDSEKVSSTVITDDVSSGMGNINITQFKNNVGVPFDYKDGYYSSNNTSLFDELSYFIGKADSTPAGVNNRQNISMAAVTMDVDCAPVIQNGLKWNSGKYCNSTYSFEEFVDAINDIFNSLNQWVPSATAVSAPLPATNRSQSSTDIYMGVFDPQNLQVWSGNMKKYQLAFGPKECGFDSNFKPVDVCMIGKYVLRTYTVKGVTVNLKNALTRPSTENDITFNPNAVDFFSTASYAASEGRNPLSGGVNSRYQRDGYPVGTQVYTFLSGTSGSNPITPIANLKDSQNEVSVTNGTLTRYDGFIQPSATVTPSGVVYPPGYVAPTGTSLEDSVKETVRFMLGATPSTLSTTTQELRTNAHGDVMHSNPVSITYVDGNNKYGRLFYQTGLGDLVSVEDHNSATNNANSGDLKWRFYPEESLQQQILIKDAFGATGGDIKKFAADGPVSTILIDKNRDGFVNPAEDHVYIAFGLRRGGRAVYMIDVTDPDAPKLQWRISNNSICTAGDSSTFSCVDANSIGTASGGIPADIPKDFLDELGYTWSAPILGVVNRKAIYTDSTLQNIVSKKGGLQPVAIFGGGYDPQEDYAERDPSQLSMGRAMYVVDALTGLPIKMWYRTERATKNNSSGSVPTNFSRVGNVITYTNAVCDAAVPLNNNKLDYPIASTAFAYNVDFDSQNTLDRIYIGDLGGQVWRFDIGASDKDKWVGYQIKDLSNYTVARSDIKYNDSTNLVSGVRRKSRKIFFPPVRAGWTRESISYDYVYVATGDIEHPLETLSHDMLAVLTDPQTGLISRCAANVDATFRDITNVGRVDRNGDGVISKLDILSPATTTIPPNYPVTYENLTKSPYTKQQIRDGDLSSGSTYSPTTGINGWYYRMERGEKAASLPRVIGGILTWTAFAPMFSAIPCSRGTGTKYYLDAYFGTTVDTNLDGKASNCLITSDETNALTKAHSQPSSGFGASTPSNADKTSDDLENILRTPQFMPNGATPNNTDAAGSRSTHCDSPRPIYNTSYGLLPSDTQVVHDGKIYRVGFTPQGNQKDGFYDDQLNPTGGFTRPSSGYNGPGALPSNPSQLGTPSELDCIANGNCGGSGPGGGPAGGPGANFGNYISNTIRPGQIYWFRDDLQ